MSVIEQYIATADKNQQPHLNTIYRLIKKQFPTATEQIKYGMPTFFENGNLVHFGAMKNHLGFYPTPDVIVHFLDDLEPYQTSKGAVQFPYQESLPIDLIERMIDYRKKSLNIS